MAKRTPYQQADKIQDQADRIYMLEEDARRCVERYVKAEAENAELRAQIESDREEYRDAANAGTLRFQAELADLRRRLAEWEERAIEFARIIGGRNEK